MFGIRTKQNQTELSKRAKFVTLITDPKQLLISRLITQSYLNFVNLFIQNNRFRDFKTNFEKLKKYSNCDFSLNYYSKKSYKNNAF